jgi:ubiquinone/menaquinone biosynthesis C-methylase UbiE
VRKPLPRSDGESATNYSARYRYRDPRIASRYDGKRFGGLLGALKHWNTMRTLARALQGSRFQGELLDCACGTARFYPLLDKIARSWTGLDVSLEMLAQARRKTQAATRLRGLVQAQAEALPHAGHSFDGVIAMRFIQHLPRAARHAVLREFYRVSREFLFVEYKIDNPVYDGMRRLLGSRPEPSRTLDDIVEELVQTGFAVKAKFPVSRLFSNAVILACEKKQLENRGLSPIY